MARDGRAQPIQPYSTHGFLGNIPPNGTLPPQTVVVTPLGDDRHHRVAPPPVLLSGAATFTQVVLPPAPRVAEPPEGRRRLTPDPLSLSGVLGGLTPPATVLPPRPVVVPVADRARRDAGGGEIGWPVPDTTCPPRPINVDRLEQRDRYRTPDPVLLSGVRAPQPAPTGTPPPPLFVPAAPRRDQNPDPTVRSGGAAPGATPPPANPPAPFVVPIDERRRFLAAIPPEVRRGFDTQQQPAAPPRPFVVPPEDRRRRPGGEVFAGRPIPDVRPPAPYVVPLAERQRLLERLAIATHGVVDPTPRVLPRIINVDREDQRARYRPLPPLLLSGVLVPQPAVVPGDVTIADAVRNELGVADMVTASVALQDAGGATAAVMDAPTAAAGTDDADGADVTIVDRPH